MSKEYTAFVAEIPQDISISNIKDLCVSIDRLDDFLLDAMFDCYSYYIESHQADSFELSDHIEEEHLFSLSEADQSRLSNHIRTKIFLKNAVKRMVLPYIFGREGDDNSFCYKRLPNNGLYVIGAGSTYAKCFPNIECAYISALNASKILDHYSYIS